MSSWFKHCHFELEQIVKFAFLFNRIHEGEDNITFCCISMSCAPFHVCTSQEFFFITQEYNETDAYSLHYTCTLIKMEIIEYDTHNGKR